MTVSQAVSVLSLAALSLTLAILYIAKTRAMNRRMAAERRRWQELSGILDSRLGFDEALVRILDTVTGIVEADGYYCYVREPRQNTLVLRAVKNIEADVKVGPSYSGLVASAKEPYTPPLGLLPDSQPAEVAIVGKQTAPILSIPLRGAELEGVIHVGPLVSPKVTRSQVQTLSSLGGLCAHMVAVLSERDRLKREIEDSSALVQVSTTMMRSSFGGSAMMTLFLNLGASLVGADGGAVLLAEVGGNPPWVPASWGVPEGVAERALLDPSAIQRVLAAKGAPTVLVTEGGALSRVPDWLLAEDMYCLWVIPIGSGNHLGALLYWFREQRRLEGHTRPAMEVIAGQLGSIARHIEIYDEMLHSYLEALKSIVALLDSQEPGTVNHSPLIAKYSEEISLGLGLPSQEREAVCLAAYLHDVGMVGLSGDILFKKGTLTQGEYEKVKGHAQLGGTLLEPLSRPVPLAPVVRHHHERYDGWGYPMKLRGDEIPLGAQIIAVADVFNAKVSSRTYRMALPFEKAMEDVKAAGGSQLDPKVVEGFVRVWERKQTLPERRGRSLEDCWVMRQCPPKIQASCPARSGAAHCWDTPDVQCHLHGDTCERCLVYTEYQYRQRRPALGLRAT